MPDLTCTALPRGTAMTLATDQPVGTRLRRLPVPRYDPPFDDELTPTAVRAETSGGDSSQQLALNLGYTLASGLPGTPELRAPIRLVDTPGGFAPPDSWEATEFGPAPRAERRRRTPEVDLPEPRRWAARLAQAVLEALSGQRPVQQLSRWTDEPVFVALSRRAGLRAARRRPRTSAHRLTVRSVRASRPAPHAVEACVVVQTGARSRAVALRLEGLDGRWLCTALDVI